MMILKEPGPWKREAQVLQQGFQKAGINATIQTLPSAQWFDQLYTKRNHKGIAVNAGTLPFPWALIANYMMKATLLAPEGKKRRSRARGGVQHRLLVGQRGAVPVALKTIQQLMLSEAAAYHTMIANNQNVAPQNLQGVDSTLIGDQRFDGAYFSAYRAHSRVPAAGRPSPRCRAPHRPRFMTPLLILVGVLLAVSPVIFAITGSRRRAEVHVGKRDDLTDGAAQAGGPGEQEARARQAAAGAVPVWLGHAASSTSAPRSGGKPVRAAVAAPCCRRSSSPS